MIFLHAHLLFEYLAQVTMPETALKDHQGYHAVVKEGGHSPAEYNISHVCMIVRNETLFPGVWVFNALWNKHFVKTDK